MRSFFPLAGGLVLFSSAAGLGCSSSGDDTAARSQDAESGQDAATSSTGTSGTTGTGLSGAQAACYALQQQVETSLEPAFEAAVAADSCTTDADCEVFEDVGSCNGGCGVITTTTGASAYQSAITASASSSACTQFVADGCSVLTGPCLLVGPGVQCLASKCVAGYSAAWTSLTVESDTGGTSASLPVSCSGSDCTTWSLTPDATVTSTGPSGAKTSTLSTSDFATVDGILRDPTFRQEQLRGFECDPAVGAQHVTEGIARASGGSSGGDISGCITGADAGASSDWQRIYAVLQTY